MKPKPITISPSYNFSKLNDWDDDDGFGPASEPLESAPIASIGINTRVVVLKHMFTLRDLEKDASLLLDLKDDVREECESLGVVTNVVLYDVRIKPRLFASADLLTRYQCNAERT